ncbi:MAG TPA: sel1 repeat family protein, partial [Nitrospinaceae bacterium]|nr:sel1 repeat family protein [Nitrospinaceae bacterium]
MKMLQKICFVLLLGTFSSVYGGDCWDGDVDDCRVRAEYRDVRAQFYLGWMYYKGLGVDQDYKEAVKWFKKSAEQGYANAQYNLGVLYEDGQGVRKDYKQAFKWYRKAAEQGYANAQFNLGFMYDHGQGVRKDY